MVNDKTKHLIDYWRNSLADAAKRNIDIESIESHGGIKININEIKTGKISAKATKHIIQKYREQKKSGKKGGEKNTKFNKEISRSEDNVEISVPVLLSPIVLSPITERGQRKTGKDKRLGPIWIFASMDGAGNLKYIADEPPWIPRNLLDPVGSEKLTLGSVDDADEYFSRNPYTIVGENNQENPLNWGDVWNYTDNLLRYVSNQSIETFHDDEYVIEPDGYIMPSDEEGREGATKHIIKLYDHLRTNIFTKNNRPIPKLLKSYSSLDTDQPKSVIPISEQIKISSRHLGQMNSSFYLSESQREAMHHVLSMKDGEILAVNGPPGTGKTTLLQSIVATMLVEAAVKGNPDPTIIVVSSSNNQAITNVIESFGKNDKDNSPLSGRWIPGIKSYGLYCPSLAKATNKYQTANLIEKGFFLSQLRTEPDEVNIGNNIEENSQSVFAAERHFLTKCGTYLGNDVASIEIAAEALRKQLIETTTKLLSIPRLWSELNEISTYISSTYDNEGGIDACILKARIEHEQCNIDAANFSKVYGKWLGHAASISIWRRLLASILPPVRRRIELLNEIFLSENNIDINGVDDDASITKYFKDKQKEFKALEQSLLNKIREAHNHKERLNQSQIRWDSAIRTCGIQVSSRHIVDLLNQLDMTLRYQAFKLATHYWEAMWLKQMKKQFSENYEEKKSEIKQQIRWRRYAKLAPATVVTLHMLPAFFSFYSGTNSDGTTNAPPLYEYIDLLILDEAGQISPETAGAAFALSKRAVVVGDVLQIEPVYGVDKSVDIGNLKHYKLASTNSDLDALDDTGIRASNGNTMLIAQRVSQYQKDNKDYPRGMFLSEHRRCVPEIIQYCNKLAYNGRLNPMRPAIPNYPYPHMGFANIRAESDKKGGSHYNTVEADVIADWIKNNRNILEAQYKDKGLSIEDIIAVVTPFRSQAIELKKALKNYKLPDEIKVGTVHVLQGAERPVIIFSPAYGSNVNTTYFFDRNKNMLNVAVSRAKDCFLVFGDMRIFRSGKNGPPSSLLADFIFDDDLNEINNIKIPKRNNLTLCERHPHIHTLEGHQEALSEALKMAQRQIWIVSPYIRAEAIKHDKIHKLIKETFERGIIVTIYTDRNMNMTQYASEKAGFRDGVKLLKESGAEIKFVSNEHSKSLMVDNSLLIEGSFNWLSAVRDRTKSYCNNERSLRYNGSDVGDVIKKNIADNESRVIELVSM